MRRIVFKLVMILFLLSPLTAEIMKLSEIKTGMEGIGKTIFKGTEIETFNFKVLGFLETSNLSFDQVFIFDVNEEVIPNTQREDTLLPYKARKELGWEPKTKFHDLVQLMAQADWEKVQKRGF